MKKTLEVLFLDQLSDIYDAENRLTRALPTLAKATTHDELCQAFESHFAETEGHVTRLEAVFQTFGKAAKARKCEAIRGLLKEGDDIASENKGSSTINAALISAAQKVGHYEIASYGCLREWAEQLGEQDSARLLGEILEEEKAADLKLTQLARERCNESAQDGDGETEVRREVRPSTIPAGAVRTWLFPPAGAHRRQEALQNH